MGIRALVRCDCRFIPDSVAMSFPERDDFEPSSGVESDHSECRHKSIFDGGAKLDWLDHYSFCYALSGMELLGL